MSTQVRTLITASATRAASARSICTVFTTSFLDSMSKMALEAMAYEDAVLPRVPEPSEPLAAAWSNLSTGGRELMRLAARPGGALS